MSHWDFFDGAANRPYLGGGGPGAHWDHHLGRLAGGHLTPKMPPSNPGPVPTPPAIGFWGGGGEHRPRETEPLTAENYRAIAKVSIIAIILMAVPYLGYLGVRTYQAGQIEAENRAFDREERQAMPQLERRLAAHPVRLDIAEINQPPYLLYRGRGWHYDEESGEIPAFVISYETYDPDIRHHLAVPYQLDRLRRYALPGCATVHFSRSMSRQSAYRSARLEGLSIVRGEPREIVGTVTGRYTICSRPARDGRAPRWALGK